MGLLRRMAIFILAMVLASPPAAAERIIAVGDLHGDYAAFIDILATAGISDGDAAWTGGETIFVQLGDFSDRGPDSLKLIRHLQALEAAAPKAGGKIVVLVGNHEAMNVTGDVRYVHPGEYAAFANRNSSRFRDQVFEENRKAIVAQYRQRDAGISVEKAHRRFDEETPLGMLEHRRAWKPSGEIGQWIAQRPAVVALGDALFVHGGMSAEYSTRSIEDINAAVSAGLAAGDTSSKSILTDDLGPLWYRGNILREPPKSHGEASASTPQRPSIEDELRQVLAAFGARRLVIGHTPNPAGIVAQHEGRLVRIDTGISAYYGGVRSYLELNDGQATAWTKDGGGIWVSQVLPSPQ
jgi:hypothetical protein